MELNAETSARVLVVEDDNVSRTMLERFFKGINWPVATAENGAKALEHVKANPVDLVVTDMMMPEMDGLQFLRAARQFDPSLAILFVSSRFEAQEVLQVLREGALDYLPKPIDFKRLRACLERVIEYQRIEDHSETILRAVRSESVLYEFTTEDLIQHPFVPPVLSRLAHVGQIDNNTKLKLLLAFQEGLANALEHGNLELPSAWKEEFNTAGEDKFTLMKKARLTEARYANRLVWIETEIKAGILRITIRDQGRGFPGAALRTRDATDNKNENLHGRGIMIMNGALDDVRYNPIGNELTLIKYL